MTIGTTEYLPLGITVYQRRSTRRQRQVTAAACAVVAASLIAAQAHYLIPLQSVEAGLSTAADAPHKTAIVAEAVVVPSPPPPTSPTPAIEPALASPFEFPDPPTILRGAGIRPR